MNGQAHAAAANPLLVLLAFSALASRNRECSGVREGNVEEVFACAIELTLGKGHDLEDLHATGSDGMSFFQIRWHQPEPSPLQIVSSNVRVHGALYYAWSLDRWPP